jgi:hypothetical protein
VGVHPLELEDEQQTRMMKPGEWKSLETLLKDPYVQVYIRFSLDTTATALDIICVNDKHHVREGQYLSNRMYIPHVAITWSTKCVEHTRV